MIESFSNSYYIGQFYVLPSASERAAMCLPDFNVVDEAYDGDGQPILKLGTCHFTVYGDTEVPLGSLEVPESILMDIDVTPDRTRQENVLIAKSERIADLLGFNR